MGISFGPQIQVYYLVAVWLFIATVGMYAITRTPLGRMANAVRDNPERAAFIGYNTQVVRYWMIILSGFFAGIAGGLSAINFELVTAENVSAARSGTVLLFSFIGGIGLFFGPMIGAVIAVLSFAVLSELTRAWQLYLGLFFVLMILYAPFGISGMIMLNVRVAFNGLYPKIRRSLAWVSGAGFLLTLAFVMLVEVGYQLFLDNAPGSPIKLFGQTMAPTSLGLWLCILASASLGGYLMKVWQPRFAEDWGRVQAEIEARELAAARAA
jgi:branched-chain amino acid transport system permease protein